MAIWPEEINNEGFRCTALEDATCLFYEGFASRAARIAGIQEFQSNHDLGSCGDFLQALQQLGADPKIHRLLSSRNSCRMMQVHVSCSLDDWTEIFGESESIEEITVPSIKHTLYRWMHFCSDGSVTCIGHLFEQSPGISWVIVMRVMMF